MGSNDGAEARQVTDPAELKYDDNGLIPAVIQQHDTGEVLMVAYMNEESLRKTLETGLTWFWSRSRQKYWQKGESSGHVQHVKRVLYDCDLDTLLVKVDQKGVACHTGERTCFYRELPSPGSTGGGDAAAMRAGGADGQGEVGDATVQIGDVLGELYRVILERKATMPEGSYTAELFRDGDNRILDKVAEESSEVIHAARSETGERVVEESADLIYHLLVLLAQKGVALEQVQAELARRRK